MTYRVTAGRVSAETNVGAGRATIDFVRGSVLPEDVPDEQLQGFLSQGLVEDVEQEQEEVEEQEQEEVDLSELDKDALLALAEERSVQVDKRWGEDKLRAALEEN